MNDQWRRMVVLLAAVAGSAGTARLGIWQLDRAAQKLALQQSIDGRAQLPPLDAALLAASPGAAEAQHYRRVGLSGQWVADRTVWLDNRQMLGVPGFFVVTPLLLADGSAVLVQRGWQPRDLQDRARITPVPTPAGPVLVRGRIAPPPARLYEFGAGEQGRIRQNLDISGFASETGLKLRPLSIWQDDAPASAGDGLQRQWPKPAVDIDRHHGYAFQWFALSALIAGLYVWFQLIRPRWRRAV
jgi:surfeit locus 1 family protein